MRWWVPLLGVGCVTTTTETDVTSFGTSCVAADVPVLDTTPPSCDAGGLPSDLYAQVSARDAGDEPCADAVCAGGAVTFDVRAVNPCDVPVYLDNGCPGLAAWTLSGPGGPGPGQEIPCETQLLTGVDLPAGESALLGTLAGLTLVPGLWTLDVDTWAAGSASLTVCLQP
jgi:hypothetical protein